MVGIGDVPPGCSVRSAGGPGQVLQPARLNLLIPSRKRTNAAGPPGPVFPGCFPARWPSCRPAARTGPARGPYRRQQAPRCPVSPIRIGYGAGGPPARPDGRLPPARATGPASRCDAAGNTRNNFHIPALWPPDNWPGRSMIHPRNGPVPVHVAVPPGHSGHAGKEPYPGSEIRTMNARTADTRGAQKFTQPAPAVLTACRFAFPEPRNRPVLRWLRSHTPGR